MKNQELFTKFKNGEIQRNELYRQLMATNTIDDLIHSVINLLLEKKEDQAPITLTQEEYNKVMSLFRIRGLKIVDGQEVIERRGRKRKLTSPFEKEE